MSKKITQETRVLNYIIDNDGITSWEAIKEFGITRLSAQIYNLRRKGYAIDNTWEHAINRYGEKVSYVRYILNKEKTFDFATKDKSVIKYPFETISCKI